MWFAEALRGRSWRAGLRVELDGLDDQPDAALEDLRKGWLWLRQQAAIMSLDPRFEKVGKALDSIASQLEGEIVERLAVDFEAEAIVQGNMVTANREAIREDLAQLTNHIRLSTRGAGN